MRLLVRFLIRSYQIVLSPALSFLAGPGNGCRFQPTCSVYFLEAVERYGAFRGSWLGVKRLARCHPWGGRGHDPVPVARGRETGAPTTDRLGRLPHSASFVCE
ncbi:MAG: membrane protein insertion efficiency factor YidD [Verrucomicrobiota bacterium]|nr:membrane protein insertion efficiency factor YidD [Verrucomicrobiota bacterium]